MNCLTVKQPWAHMIANLGKTVENRTWETRHRGLLAIHAGAYSGWDKAAEASPVALEAWKRWAGVLATGEVATPLTRGDACSFLSFGAVVAVAEVAGCHHSDECMHAEHLVPPGQFTGCSPWAVRGQWHIELTGARPLDEPVRVRGMLGLWCLPEDVEKAVRGQLEEGDS